MTITSGRSRDAVMSQRLRNLGERGIGMARRLEASEEMVDRRDVRALPDAA